MFEKILVATDGSENAKEAIEHAASLSAMAKSSEVIVLHVCTACSTDLDPEETHLEAAKTMVKDAGEIIKASGISVSHRIETDYPIETVGNAIIDIAAAEDADLIILGSRGLSEFKGMLLGSVSSRVVQKAACPVLVVKSEVQEAQD
jgi:nucleotide-binding universal stress UspA family protein